MSLELDRRSFLVGLFGTAVVATAGPLVKLAEPFDSTAWATAISKVYGNYISDLLIFGCAAIRADEKFPYIRNIHPSEMTMDELKQVPDTKFAAMFDDHSPARRAVSDAIGQRAMERAEAERKVLQHYHLEPKA